MPTIVKTKYITALRTKLAELRATKMTNAQIVATLNAPVLEKSGDVRADPPMEATYGPSWAQSIGLGQMLPEFVAQVDRYAGLSDEAVRDELAKELLEACVCRELRAEGRTVEDAVAEVAVRDERTRWEKVVGIVAEYTGVTDEKRVESLAAARMEVADDGAHNR